MRGEARAEGYKSKLKKKKEEKGERPRVASPTYRGPRNPSGRRSRGEARRLPWRASDIVVVVVVARPSNPIGSGSGSERRGEGMDEAAAAEAVQLIDGEGEFAADSAERFMAAAGVAGCGLSYAVVSIMGPQSSGTYGPIPSLAPCRDRLIDRPPRAMRHDWVSIDPPHGTCSIKCFGARAGPLRRS